MADKAEINAAIQEALKEHMDAMNERIDGILSQALETLAVNFAAKLLPQPMAPAATLPVNNPDKVPEPVVTPVVPLENVVLTGASSATSSEVPISQSSPVAGGMSEQAMRIIAQMEQRLREVEGTHNIVPVDLSVYSKVQVPEKFKMPDFEKYDGTSNPVQHIQMYQARMNKYVANGPLMVQTFQASLKDSAMRWYTDYEIYRMEDWEKAANVFIKHFSFNLDVIISREDLEQSEMTKGETIKQYATRWRNIAAQLKPVPPERELMRLFVSTLPQAIRSRILGTAATSFSHLIAIGEEVEIGLKKGWYSETSFNAKRFPAKKDNEPAPQVNMTYVQKHPVQASKAQVHNQRSAHFESQGQKGNRRNSRQFTALPGTLSQVLAVLRKNELLTTEPLRPNYASFAKYDPSKKCDYHRDEPGHDTDDCSVLKNRIQDLLESGAFAFQQADQPNVQNNPLPNHAGD